MRPALTLAVAAASMGFSCAHRLAHTPTPPAQPNAVARAMARQVQNAVDAGDGDYQVRVLRQRLAAEPDNVDVRLELAALYETKGFPEVALEHYRLAATRFPDDVRGLTRLVRSLRSYGQTAEARELIDRFVARQDSRASLPELHAWSGILHDELGELEAGERQHRLALQQSEPKAYLHNNLGQNLLLQGKTAEAAEQFRRALALEPRSEIARNNLGIALASNPGEAVLHWQSVSDPSTAHNNLAAILIEQGRYQEARRQLNIALGYKPDNYSALRNLWLLSELDGKPPVIEPQGRGGFWQRSVAALRKLFVSKENPKPAEAGKQEAALAASR